MANMSAETAFWTRRFGLCATLSHRMFAWNRVHSIVVQWGQLHVAQAHIYNSLQIPPA